MTIESQSTEEKACAAIDVVLREWADIDGEALAAKKADDRRRAAEDVAVRLLEELPSSALEPNTCMHMIADALIVFSSAGEQAATALSQAWSLLQRARWCVKTAGTEATSNLAAEIDAFLAGLPVTSNPEPSSADTWAKELAGLREAP